MGNTNEGGHIVLNLIARLQQIPTEIEPIRDPEAAAATRERLMAAFRDEHMVHVPVQPTMPDEVMASREALRLVTQHDGEWMRFYDGEPGIYDPDNPWHRLQRQQYLSKAVQVGHRHPSAYMPRHKVTEILERVSEGSPEGMTALPSRELGDTLST